MKNILKCAAACLTIFALSNCSHKDFVDGTYQQTKITADGDLSDWGLPLRYESKLNTMQYSITNDDNNIYVSLYTTDNAAQLKILKSGVDIYIDPTGHENKKMVISFPMKESNSNYESQQQNTSSMAKFDKIKMKQEMIMESNTFNVAGFKNIENRLYDIKDSSNIRVALKLDLLGNMGYEMIIPIKAILGTKMTSDEADRRMTVGIIVKALQKNEITQGQHHFGVMNGMGAMGMRHSGMGGGFSHRASNNSDNNNPDGAAQYKEDDNWYKFKIAYKKL